MILVEQNHTGVGALPLRLQWKQLVSQSDAGKSAKSSASSDVFRCEMRCSWSIVFPNSTVERTCNFAQQHNLRGNKGVALRMVPKIEGIIEYYRHIQIFWTVFMAILCWLILTYSLQAMSHCDDGAWSWHVVHVFFSIATIICHLYMGRGFFRPIRSIIIHHLHLGNMDSPPWDLLKDPPALMLRWSIQSWAAKSRGNSM